MKFPSLFTLHNIIAESNFAIPVFFRYHAAMFHRVSDRRACPLLPVQWHTVERKHDPE